MKLQDDVRAYFEEKKFGTIWTFLEDMQARGSEYGGSQTYEVFNDLTRAGVLRKLKGRNSHSVFVHKSYQNDFPDEESRRARYAALVRSNENCKLRKDLLSPYSRIAPEEGARELDFEREHRETLPTEDEGRTVPLSSILKEIDRDGWS